MSNIDFNTTKLTQALVKCKSVTPIDDGAIKIVQSHLSSIGFVCTPLSFSDPDSYEGGEFYFYNGNKEEIEPEIKKQGSIVCFDSRMWHRVAPVTKGVRYSLVSWILGPRFQ